MEAFIKGECRHCKGHIDFPEQLLGSHIQCPHCQGEVTLKPIVKIAARAQATSPLPAVARLHLQPAKSAEPPPVARVPLPAGLPPLPPLPAKPPATPPPAAKPEAKPGEKPEEKTAPPAAASATLATRRRRVLAVLVPALILAALAAGIFLVRKPLIQRLAKLRESAAGFMTAAAPATNAVPPPPKLLVLSYDLERQAVAAPAPVKKKKNKKSAPPVQPKPLIYVSGVATNVSTNACMSVKVSFELLDAEGKAVDTNSDEIFRLEGQSDWRFRALVTHPNAIKPHLLSIQCQP